MAANRSGNHQFSTASKEASILNSRSPARLVRPRHPPHHLFRRGDRLGPTRKDCTSLYRPRCQHTNTTGTEAIATTKQVVGRVHVAVASALGVRPPERAKEAANPTYQYDEAAEVEQVEQVTVS
jgi:hypothetical protein